MFYFGGEHTHPMVVRAYSWLWSHGSLLMEFGRGRYRGYQGLKPDQLCARQVQGKYLLYTLLFQLIHVLFLLSEDLTTMRFSLIAGLFPGGKQSSLQMDVFAYKDYFTIHFTYLL